MNSYNIFASYYDELSQNVNYDKILDFICQNTNRSKLLVDLACGTGTLTVKLAQNGFDVVGVDASSSMLAQAMNKSSDQNTDILFLNQNLTELDLYGTADIMLSTLDSLNHMKNADQVATLIQKVSLFLNPDGLFIFDVNSLYKMRSILANNTFIYDLEHLYCIWQNYYHKDDHSVDISLDFFCKVDKLYRREAEAFTEIYLAPDFINECLKQNGLSILSISDDYSDKKPNPKTQRITYVARKDKN